MEALATDESEKTSATVGDEVSEKRGRGRPLSKRQTRGIKRPNEDDQTPKVSTRKQRKQSTTAGQTTGTGSVPMEIEKVTKSF